VSSERERTDERNMTFCRYSERS